MTCPEYIGRMYGVTLPPYALNGTGEYIYGFVPITGTRFGLRKFTFPDLVGVTTRTPDLGFDHSAFSPVISPHVTGGTTFGDDDGVASGDLLHVVSTVTLTGRIVWIPQGVGGTYFIHRTVDGYALSMMKDSADANYIVVLTTDAATNYWHLQRILIPPTEAAAAAMSPAPAQLLNALGEFLDDGTAPESTSSALRDPVTTPDGAIWMLGKSTSDLLQTWRWHPDTGMVLLDDPSLFTPADGHARGAFGMIPRPDSHTWHSWESTPFGSDTYGMDVSPDGTQTLQPCLDTAETPDLGVLENVRLNTCGYTRDCRRVAANYFNGRQGDVWALDAAPSRGWVIDAVAF